MANLREHCSWVHNDRPLATAKAIEIVGMLVAKVGRDEALTTGRAELTKRLLVIGGGIAGIQAALDVANAGYQVTLVERTPTIGGKMAMLDKTFPTLDCSACILTPLMVDVAQHPNIELRAYAEVERVQGFVGNFKVTIRQKARYVNHVTCTGCGTCWGKCPDEGHPVGVRPGARQAHLDLHPLPPGDPEQAGDRRGTLPLPGVSPRV